MKTMKNILIAIAASALVMPVFNGCKKGEGDPAISLKSRKSRVAGEWTVSSMKSSWSSTSGTPSVTSSGTYSYDGTNVITTSTSGGTTTTSPVAPATHTKTWTVTFEKDGTFKSSQVETQTGGTAPYNYTTVTTTEESGTWTFEGGTGESKKKEYLSSYITSSTWSTASTVGSTTTNTSGSNTDAGKGGSPSVWQLTTLKSKEIVAHQENTSSNSSTGGGTTTSSSGTSSSDMTLTAK